MDVHWAPAIVEELRRIDREEVPHGLYGLRQARQVDGCLPKMSAILSGPSVQLIQRIGGTPRYRRPSDEDMSFGLAGPRIVELRLRTHADTKVRKFGSEYRLDKTSHVVHDPVPDMCSEVPKLSGLFRGYHGRSSAVRSFGTLFIGHFKKEKDGLELLGRSLSTEFIIRYNLDHVGASWVDAHGRDFWTFVSLWFVDQVRPVQGKT